MGSTVNLNDSPHSAYTRVNALAMFPEIRQALVAGADVASTIRPRTGPRGGEQDAQFSQLYWASTWCLPRDMVGRVKESPRCRHRAESPRYSGRVDRLIQQEDDALIGQLECPRTLTWVERSVLSTRPDCAPLLRRPVVSGGKKASGGFWGNSAWQAAFRWVIACSVDGD